MPSLVSVGENPVSEENRTPNTIRSDTRPSENRSESKESSESLLDHVEKKEAYSSQSTEARDSNINEGNVEQNVLPGFNLGSLGSVIRIDASYTKSDGEKKQQPSLPMPVIVLDRSGSMGQWVSRMIRDIFPALLRMAGYDGEQPVILITFDSAVERVKYCGRDPTVEDLPNLKDINSRGATHMAPSIEKLAAVLNETQCNSHVLVVSDGLVHDMDAVIRNAQKHQVQATTPLSFTLVRLLTSAGAQPDTRALACLGSWSTVADHTPVIDLPCANYSSPEEFLNRMFDASSSPYFRGCSGDYVVVEAEADVLRQTPLQAPVRKLQLYPKASARGTVLLLVAPGVTALRINGDEHIISVQKKPDEGDLMPLLMVIENQMRMWAVMGKSCSENMKKVNDWLTEVQTRLATDEMVLPEGTSTKARTQRLIMQIRHRQKQVISRIKELGNADLVAGLNAQQQAQFLRQTANTAQGRGLAKRAQKTDGELDFDGLCRDALRKVGDISLDQVGEEDGTVSEGSTAANEEMVSFYSLSGFPDILDACKELASEVEDMNAGEVLQIVGGLGVGFNAPQGDFPDPWSFRVTDVFCHANLSEADVWLHHMQQMELMDTDNKSGNQTHVLHLSPPGTHNKYITGVIPLDLHPVARVAFRGPLRNIRELQAGLMMRRTLARVPWDVVARDTAVAWCIISQKMAKTIVKENGGFFTSLTELQALTLARIMDNMKFGGVKELKENMMRADPRPYFTGDLDVSNVLKLIAVTLRSHDPLTPTLLRAMFHLDAYHQARKHFKFHDDGDAQARKKALCEFLGLNLSNPEHFTATQPLFQPEPDTVAHYDQYDTANVEMFEKLPPWIQSAHQFMALQRVCECVSEHALKKTQNGVKGINKKFVDALCSPTVKTVESAFGVDHAGLFLAASYVTALMTTNENERVDKENRVALVQDPVTAEDTRSFLRGVVRDLVREDYEVRLREKARAEALARMAKLHDDLYQATAFQTFVDLLQQIPSRSSDGFNTIHDTLLDFSLEVPLRGEKLWVLLTGRNSAGEPIWAQGNIMYGSLDQYKPVFARLGKEQLFRGVLKLKEKFGVYRYRNANANRHGHSNDFPSWWALGFTSILDYRDRASESEWSTYLSKRLDKYGNLRPAPMETPVNPVEYDRLTMLMKRGLTDYNLTRSEQEELLNLGKTHEDWGPSCRSRSRKNAYNLAFHARRSANNLAGLKKKTVAFLLGIIGDRKTLKA